MGYESTLQDLLPAQSCEIVRATLRHMLRPQRAVRSSIPAFGFRMSSIKDRFYNRAVADRTSSAETGAALTVGLTFLASGAASAADRIR
jgi:hypothetical protein